MLSAIVASLDKIIDVAKALPGLRRDQKRKATLRQLLEAREFRWRSIATLSRAVGASEEKTRELLVSIGARASVGGGREMWGLRSRVDDDAAQRAQARGRD